MILVRVCACVCVCVRAHMCAIRSVLHEDVAERMCGCELFFLFLR